MENPPHLRARWPPRRPRILSGREEPAAGARPRETPIYPPARETRKQKNRTPQRRQAESSRRRDVSSSAVDQLARQQPQRNGRRGDGADGAAARAAAPNVGEVIDGKQWQFNAEQIIGNGSFGVVFRATIVETGAVVAIKKVLQDKRFKNRELHIMKQLRSEPHPNVIQLQHQFYSSGERSDDEVYLESSTGVHARHRVWCREGLAEGEDALTDDARADLRVAALPSAGPDPRGGHLPPRHQAPELAAGSEDARREAHRLWLRESFGTGRAERVVHLLAVDYYRAPEMIFGSHGVHDGHRRLVVRVCFCGAVAGRTAVSRGFGRPVGGNHQGAGTPSRGTTSGR